MATRNMSYFYAVAKGRAPGVYTTWNEAKKQVDGFNYPKFRKFETKDEADAFVKQFASKVATVPKTAPKPDDDLPQNPTPSVQKDGLVVFTDGSALGNGKKGAKAGYAAVWPNHPHLTFAKPLEGDTKTNNRAEFMACIDALEAANREDPTMSEIVHVYTDSELLINTVTKWMRGWKRNGWKKSSGDPIMNADLVKRLDELVGGRKVMWTHVDAHTGGTDWMSTWNDKVDKLARSAAA